MEISLKTHTIQLPTPRFNQPQRFSSLTRAFRFVTFHVSFNILRSASESLTVTFWVVKETGREPDTYDFCGLARAEDISLLEVGFKFYSSRVDSDVWRTCCLWYLSARRIPRVYTSLSELTVFGSAKLSIIHFLVSSLVRRKAMVFSSSLPSTSEGSLNPW